MLNWKDRGGNAAKTRGVFAATTYCNILCHFKEIQFIG